MRRLILQLQNADGQPLPSLQSRGTAYEYGAKIWRERDIRALRRPRSPAPMAAADVLAPPERIAPRRVVAILRPVIAVAIAVAHVRPRHPVVRRVIGVVARLAIVPGARVVTVGAVPAVERRVEAVAVGVLLASRGGRSAGKEREGGEKAGYNGGHGLAHGGFLARWQFVT